MIQFDSDLIHSFGTASTYRKNGNNPRECTGRDKWELLAM
jgi:hypothetical protein